MIRLAQVEDLLQIAQWEFAYAWEKLPESQRELLTLQEAFKFIAGEGMKPQCRIFTNNHGFSLTYLTKVRWYGELVLHLDHTYIEPEARSIATHSQNLRELAQEARKMGATKLSTLWAPQAEVERVEKAMQRSGWQPNGTYFEYEV